LAVFFLPTQQDGGWMQKDLLGWVSFEWKRFEEGEGEDRVNEWLKKHFWWSQDTKLKVIGSRTGGNKLNRLDTSFVLDLVWKRFKVKCGVTHFTINICLSVKHEIEFLFSFIFSNTF
jgi:hypothetical protein